MKYYLIEILIILFCLSCWENEHKSPKDESNNNSSSLVDETLTMEDCRAAGFVKDPAGNPIADVTVTTGEKSTITNNAGVFYLDRIGVVNNRAVFKFTKDGYFPIVRSNIREDENSVEVTLCPKGNSAISCATTFNTSSGKQLNAGGMLVDLKPLSMIVESTGKPYSGTVKADMLYMNPNDENFSTMMPGSDMAAVRSDRSETMLYSYGMASVSLTADDGTPLQLQEGKQSTVSFPIPEGMENNPPQSIPLWHFNDKAGIWVESGTATLAGEQYVGEVSHFSVVNLDIPEPFRATLTIKVVDKDNNPVPYLPVQISQIQAKTDENGLITRQVSSDPIRIRIRSEDYGYGFGSFAEGKYIFSREIPAIGGGRSHTEIIQLPNAYTVKGQMVNTCSPFSSTVVSLESVSDLPFVLCTQQTGMNGMFSLRVAPEITDRWRFVGKTGGTPVEREIYLDRNIDLGEINVCITPPAPDPEDPGTGSIGAGVQIRISYAGKFFDFKYDPDPETDGAFIIDNTLLFLNWEAMGLYINNYSPDKTSYSDAWLDLEPENAWYEGETVLSITPVGRQFMKIQLLSGIGEFHVYAADKTYDAEVISGEIDIPVVARGSKKYNVSSLNGVDIPKFITAPTPVDLLVQITESTLWEKAGELFYKKSLTDYEQLKKTIKQTGFQEVYQNEEIAAYCSGNDYILLSYSNTIFSHWEGDETEYNLSIMMIQGCKIDPVRWHYGVETAAKTALQHKAVIPFMKRIHR